MDAAEVLIRAALVGSGATIVLDVFQWIVARALGIPGANWAMVGRWLGHMPGGTFVQRSLETAARVPGELAIGWFFHYAVGIGYALVLVAVRGSEWLDKPTLLPPLALSWALLVLPYFVMQPGMGMGVAARKTPKPSAARVKSVIGHSVFGLGMFMTAKLLASVA